MAATATLCPLRFEQQECQDVCIPAVKYHPHIKHAIHAGLRVFRESSPPPDHFSVRVINGSDGKVVHLRVSSADTIAKLRAQLCEAAPEWKDMHLAFNGKPVMEHQCLRDLGVKEGAMFVTFRRCRGG